MAIGITQTHESRLAAVHNALAKTFEPIRHDFAKGSYFEPVHSVMVATDALFYIAANGLRPIKFGKFDLAWSTFGVRVTLAKEPLGEFGSESLHRP